MKEFEIKVKAPEGKKPVYDEKSQTITFVPINIREQVKTFDDARRILGISEDVFIPSDPQLYAIMRLRIILQALNEGHEFSLTEGDVWYPWVRFYEEHKLPTNEKKNVIRSFTLNGKKYLLVGGCADTGTYSGLGLFDSYDGVGVAYASVGMFACKDEETALYVSSQFGDLVFQAIYGHSVNYYWN